MKLYARSDVMSVAVPSANGGCGEMHSRPVASGAPLKLWQLTCDRCCEALKYDPLWSAEITRVPETYDEKIAREDREKRGQDLREQQSQDAMVQIAEALSRDAAFKDRLMDVMSRFGQLSGDREIGSAVRLCLNGHINTADARFCATCGASMEAPVSAVSEENNSLRELTSQIADGTLSIDELRAQAGSNPFGTPETSIPVRDDPVCIDCGKAIERKPGTRGPVPKRCRACKGKR